MSFHVSVRTFLSLLCSLMDVSKPDCFIDMILCPQLLSPPPLFLHQSTRCKNINVIHVLSSSYSTLA
jgi:hypothetical protein